MASVDQTSPSKVSIQSTGDISPQVMCQFKHGCMNFFIHKKVIADDQVSLIIGGIMDSHVNDWIVSDRDHLIALLFAAFMSEFRLNYLAKDWEEDTLCELLSMTQGTSLFWDYAIAIQSKNSLLQGTVSHLPDDKLHHQLGTGMEIRLSKKVSLEKVNKVQDFYKWLNDVRRCDDVLRVEREEYECIVKDNRESSHRTNFSNEPSLRRIPNQNNNPSASSSSAAANSATISTPP